MDQSKITTTIETMPFGLVLDKTDIIERSENTDREWVDSWSENFHSYIHTLSFFVYP